jgi:uncharacterized protein (TIGR03663 family)
MDNRGWRRPGLGIFHPLTAALLILAAAALALWSLRLEERPMHNDEAVNGVKFGQLWGGGGYKYDPNEHHGPSLYYATFALSRLTSAPKDLDQFSESRLRLTAVLFGAGLIALLALVSDGLGKRATLWAALWTLASPAVAFYSRYYIHEALLVFATFLAIAAGWRYSRGRNPAWAMLVGVGVGLMQGTKETFVLSLFAGGLALVMGHVWNRSLEARGVGMAERGWCGKHLAAGLGAWAVVWLVLFSSFFSHWQGLADSFRTFLPWLHRAEGASPHIHPWTFYLHRLLFFHAGKGPVWSEALILLLAMLGARAGFVRQGLADANASFVRFLSIYSLALTAAYALIPYKTPWCLLGFWHGLILLAGVGAAWLIRRARGRVGRIVLTVLLLAGAGHLAWQSVLANGPYAADSRNPYNYAQTSPDIMRLVDQVEALATVHPQGRQMLVKVMAPEGDYWPLPWYLRNLRKVGWWEELPADPYAPVMIVSSQLHADLDARGTHVMAGYFQLRPQVFLELYVQLDLWQAYLAQHPPKGD